MAELATLTTTSITNITAFTATGGGNITSDGGALITARGICWSTSANPTIANSKTTDMSGIGLFTSSLTNLSAGTSYFVRAYAINGQGVAYGSSQTFTTSDILFNPLLSYGVLNDADGNTYKTITIGKQVWMAENLKTTKYNDGTGIANVTSPWENLTSGAYCWYNNDAATVKATYGACYNCYAISTGKLCPAGWHVPTTAEWNILIKFLGGENVAGASLKEAGTRHWLYPNIDASNSSGFTALPGGSYGKYGYFGALNGSGYWWSSTDFDSSNTDYFYLFFDDGKAGNWHGLKSIGNSVRCIQN